MSPFILLTGISTCLKAWILWLGTRRKLIADFPWFFLYIIYAFSESVARVSVSNNRKLYFYVYWTSEALDLTLLSIAIGESFSRTLRPFAKLKGVRTAFWICVAAPVLYSASRSIIEPPAQTVPWVAVILGIEITLLYLIMAMTFLYFALVHLFNIRDHRYESGIMQGFAINASISACGYLIRSIFGTKFLTLSSSLPPLAFVIAEGFWIAALMRRPVSPEAAPPVSLTPDEIIRLLDRHLEVLRRLLGRRFS
jgi:hypothetical protein